MLCPQVFHEVWFGCNQTRTSMLIKRIDMIDASLHNVQMCVQIFICTMLCCITAVFFFHNWNIFNVTVLYTHMHKQTATSIPPLRRHTNTKGHVVHRRPNYKLQPGLVCNKVGRNSSLLSPRGNARVILLANNTK